MLEAAPARLMALSGRELERRAARNWSSEREGGIWGNSYRILMWFGEIVIGF
jgi:hypothetical protein